MLRRTYGDELVILDGTQQAVCVSPTTHHGALMLSSGIMQRAFLEAIVLGLACGPLGVWILLLRRSYAAESLSHAMLPGLVIAALAGVPLLFGAAAGVLVAAGGIALVARDARAGGDIGVAVVVSGLFGLGGILALSPETPPRLGELLFGDLLGLTNGDLVAAAALCGGGPDRARASATARCRRPRSRAAAHRRSGCGRPAPISPCWRCWRSRPSLPSRGSATCCSWR